MASEGWKSSDAYLGLDFKKAEVSKLKFPPAIMDKINAWWKKKSDILVFCGSVGVGKSYAAYAFCRLWAESIKFPHNHYLFLVEKEIYDHLQPPHNPGFCPAYEQEKLRETPFVVIDDFGSAKKSEFRDETIFSVINGRIISRFPTIVTTNLFLKDIKDNYDPRLYSRLTDIRNTVIELVDEDLRQTMRD
jgi:DNA replication protein DnaC